MSLKNSMPKEVERICIGCRNKRTRAGMVRVLRLSDGSVVVGDEGVSGRGAYICRDVNCVRKALANKRKNAFEHALKINVPEEVIAKVREIVGDQ